MKVAVTTSRDDKNLFTEAQEIAGILEIEYIPRQKRSLDSLRVDFGLDYLIIVEINQVIIKGETVLSWHPSMAVPRIKALREGKKDHLIEAMALEEGYHVLDCTLGLGSDALVAAYAVGPEGHVTGLEDNKIIAFITKWGVSHFRGQNNYIRSVLDRITVLNTNYKDFLNSQPSNSYDTVYFDPMFRYARKQSSSMNALRPFANHQPLSEEILCEALRITRHRVVVRESPKGKEFERLKPHFIIGGRFSPIAYGVWEKRRCIF